MLFPPADRQTRSPDAVSLRLRGQVARWALLALFLAIAGGCGRAHYRRQADREVYGLVDSASLDPRWPLDDYTIRPDRHSRFFDPYSPDCPPMPPDDPTAHQLLHYVDGKRNWPYEEHYGCTDQVENPAWMESLAPYLKTEASEGGEKRAVVVDRQAAMNLALLHSREYQTRLEELYLSALDVSFQRFAFDVQFFGGNATSFTKSGPLSGSGSDSSELATDTSIRARRLCATGGQLAAEVANSVVWQFSGADSYVSTTPLSFSLIQPLLRGAGRAVVLNQLTSTERAFLADVRDLERFRREFYIDIIAGGGGRAGALLGLLRDQVQIRNQERNVVSLEDSLRQLETAAEFGQESVQSVELVRQDLFRGQSRLLSLRAEYQTALDGYKITLGVPPDLEVRVEDPLLERFNLIDPTMTATQDRVDALGDQLRDPDVPMPSDFQARAAAARQECEFHLDAVQKDIESLLEALPGRREALLALSARDEFRRGEVDASAGSVDLLHQRVIENDMMEYYGPGDPRVEQLAGELLTTSEQHDWYQRLQQRVRAAGIEGVSVTITRTLAELEAFEQDPEAVTAAINARLELGKQEGEEVQPYTPKEVLADLITRLWRQLVRLSVVQARARLDAITLVSVDLNPEEALRIASANRRDWMNARATLVDSWRQIEVAANDLRSDLDVAFSGDLTTTSSTFGANNTMGSLQARLEFDAPLTRLAERNAYREALINYQRARRDYYAYEDSVNQSLRALLRNIRLNQLDFEISRGSVWIAITRVNQARRELERPPGEGQARGGIASTRELVNSLNSLLAEQNTFSGAWTDYELRRMQLDLDLGTMQLDDRGMWIDPGPIEGDASWTPGGAEEIPTPPAIPLDFDFPPVDQLPPLPQAEGPAPAVAIRAVRGMDDAEDPRRRASLRPCTYDIQAP